MAIWAVVRILLNDSAAKYSDKQANLQFYAYAKHTHASTSKQANKFLKWLNQ